MADWTTLDTNGLLPGEPLTSEKALAFYNNPIAIAERSAGAPRVVTDYEPIASAVASTDATIDFTGFDAAKYVGYVIHLANVVPSSDGADLLFRTSANGGSTYDSGASDYAWATVGHTPAEPDAALAGAIGDTSIRIAPSVGSAGGEDGVTGSIFIMGPDLIKRSRISWSAVSQDNGGNLDIINGGGQRAAAAAVNAVRLLFSAGTVGSGEIHLFGLRGA